MYLSLKKTLDLSGIWTHDFCDTSAVLYQLRYQAKWGPVTLWVRNIPVDDKECKWIYGRLYIWTGEKDMKIWLIIAVIHVHTTLAVVKLKPEKIWRDRFGRALHRYGIDHGFGSCSSKNKNNSGLYFTTATVVCIIVMINHFFISFSTVKIYDLSYIHLHSSSSTGILRTHNVTSSLLAW